MTDKEIKEHIRELIQKYDYYNPIRDRMKALRLGKVKNKEILDVGTGKGHLAILAVKEFNCNVTTIDNSKEKINIAKNNAKNEGVTEKINFRIGDAANTSFQDNSFDTVVSFNTLHHDKENYKKIIQEMFRVTKRNVIISELNEKGAIMFDEYLYPTVNHKNLIINLMELEDRLKRYSDVKKFDRKLMSTFVCDKNIQ